MTEIKRRPDYISTINKREKVHIATRNWQPRVMFPGAESMVMAVFRGDGWEQGDDTTASLRNSCGRWMGGLGWTWVAGVLSVWVTGR